MARVYQGKVRLAIHNISYGIGIAVISLPLPQVGVKTFYKFHLDSLRNIL
jgi:hypothetical protein